MPLFITRRTYNASKKKFTNNLAALSRHVFLQKTPAGKLEGGIISQADWLDQLAQASNGNGVLFYVHGFNTDQPSMLSRLEKVEEGLKAAGFQGAIVAFDWPSEGNVLAYDADRRMSKDVAPFLIPDAVHPVTARLPGQNVSFLCHSMGCFLTLRALSGEGDHVGQVPCQLDEVLFTAADVDAEALRQGAWGALVMEKRCTRFTNYYSVADKVLALSGGLIHGGQERAGHVGMPDLKAANSVDVYTTAQFRKHVPVADQGKQILSHNWYYDDAGFYRDAKLTIEGTAAAAMPTRRDTDQVDKALLT